MKPIISCAVLALASIVSIGEVAAQDRPAPGERRERLRELGRGLIGNVLRPLVEEANAEVDVNRLNDQFSGMLGSLMSGDTAVEHLSLRLDPEETDLANDQISARARVALRHSAWSDYPSDLRIDALAFVDRTDDGRLRGNLDARLQMKTDVLGLAQWGIEQWMERAAKTTADETTADGYFARQMFDRLQRTGPPRTMDELADLFTYGAGVRQVAAGLEIEYLTVDLDRAIAAHRADPPRATIEEVEDLDRRLFEARVKRDAMYDARPRIHRDRDGFVREITIDMDNSQPVEGAHIERLQLSVAEGGVRVAMLGSTTKGMEAYQIVKPLAVRVLRRIQDRRPGEGPDDAFARGFYDRTRRVIIGEEF